MSYFIDICFICLKHSNNLTNIKNKDVKGLSFLDKLKYFLPGLLCLSNIPKYICARCGRNLSRIYEFKQKCLQNMTTYENYAQQLTTTDSSFKYLFVVLNPVLVCKTENIPELQTEMIENVEEFTIKEEEKLVLDDGLELLLREMKDDTNNKNEDIVDNTQGNIDKEEKLYKCEVCNKSFLFLYHFKRHQLIHTNNKPYACKICEKSFRRLEHLIRHHSIHSDEKPFTCEVCNETFIRSADLKQHKLIHTTEKSFTCEICQQSFRQLINLRQHQLIHTGVKSYSCEVCNKHNIILKSYVCEVCGKSFRQLSILRRHRQIQHYSGRAFKCKVCKKSFRQIHHLKRHWLTHTGEKPYTCEVCNRSFSDESNFRRHKLVRNHIRVVTPENNY